MKKKLAIVLSLVLACSMSMTAVAAPSPSIVKEPVAQVVVSSSVEAGTAVAAQAGGVVSERSAVLPGTTFKTASGQVIDTAAVALVVAPASVQQAQASAASIATALASVKKMQIVNFTGRKSLSLTDSQGRLNVVNNVSLALQTAAGELVSHNGSISAAFAVSDILGSSKLAAGETIQALYQRADGTWVALPILMKDGVLAIGLPAFNGAVNVTFVITKGDALEDITAVVKSPRT